VAVSDDRRRVASALTVVARGASHAADHAQLATVIAETGAAMVVVGLPLSLSGGAGPAARGVLAEVAEMREVLDVPVECCDERYSTVIASRALATGGRRPAARRAIIDKVAAAAILQTWLDRQRDWPWPQAGPAAPSR
jgi:putative Holliday junction resolvase